MSNPPEQFLCRSINIALDPHGGACYIVGRPLNKYNTPDGWRRSVSSRLNPYLTFNGNARQAMEFYDSVFGGELALDTFAEFGAADSADSPDADRVFHARLETSEGYTIMASDLTSDKPYQPMAGCSLSLSGDAAARLRGYWDKLSAGGTIRMPMEKQVWGDEFGMCVDKFGVSWMVNISEP
jgi:PhnB protein